MMLAWAVAGALLVAALVYSARVMKKGITTLDETRARNLERIHDGERQLLEDRKNMPLDEHVHILWAAVADLLHLAGNPEGLLPERKGRQVILHTPQGCWHMAPNMRQTTLHSSHRTVQGRSRWLLQGFGKEEHFDDVAGLMRALHLHLQGERLSVYPKHLARRLQQGPEAPSPAGKQDSGPQA